AETCVAPPPSRRTPETVIAQVENVPKWKKTETKASHILGCIKRSTTSRSRE
ncbi:unnamed protein product, partial [Bubo scandiacus]